MFGSIAGRYDVTNSVLSFGIHHLWRRALIRSIPPLTNGLALDLCTGTGDLLKPLAKRFGRVVGADFCLPMMRHGVEKAAAAGSGFLGYAQGDAMRLPFADAVFDVVSVAFGVRNFEDRHRGLREIFRVLKPGGHALILEFGQPKNFFMRAGYQLYSKWGMPVIGGALTGNKDAYSYLPETAKEFPCGEDFCALLRECGLQPKNTRALTGGIAYMYAARKEADT